MVSGSTCKLQKAAPCLLHSLFYHLSICQRKLCEEENTCSVVCYRNCPKWRAWSIFKFVLKVKGCVSVGVWGRRLLWLGSLWRWQVILWGLSVALLGVFFLLFRALLLPAVAKAEPRREGPGNDCSRNAWLHLGFPFHLIDDLDDLGPWTLLGRP